MDELDRDRLAKLLGMLGAAHDGEVLAAARQAERVRQASAMTWAEILNPPGSEVVYVQVDDGDDYGDPEDFPSLLRRLLRDARLTDWERGFCRSLLKRRKRLTLKQSCVLDRIRGKYGRRSWAA